jgi:DNA-binding CsgD family transcriptional regulator
VIFDSGGRVWFANAAADHYSAHGEGLAIEDGVLTLADPAGRAAYEAYLRRSVEHAERGQRVSPIVLRVPSKKSTSPYRVLVSPLELGVYAGGMTAGNGNGSSNSTNSSHGLPRWHVLMQYAPDGRRHLPKRLLVELYRLTSAEADLVALLLQGATPEGAAAALGESMNTIKSQLQHVFVKCEVHSKGELMQLLMSGPRTL